MPSYDGLLDRWRQAGVLDAQSEARIRAFEEAQEKSGVASIRWQGMIALVLGAILLVCGVALFVSAHWDQLGTIARFTIVMLMVAAFHFGGGLAREKSPALSTTLHAVGTLSCGTAIALVGQIFNIQEHWPAAVLMWALAAVAGWMLLRDEVQQVIALLLIPAWMCSEISFYTSGDIGAEVFMGRALVVWAILYLTYFVGSERRIVHGTLFAAAAVCALVGTALITSGWVSWYAAQGFVPFGVRVWAWIIIAALPLVIAAFHGHKGLIPIAAAVVYVTALPWCARIWTRTYGAGQYQQRISGVEPNIFAHSVVALFAVFLCYWGVRLASRALVNLSIVYFGIAVAWFYFSDVFDKVGRSLGLIGLGILFLAGGWILEKTRRKLMLHIDSAKADEGVAL